MDVGAVLVAGEQTLEGVQPGEAALDDPPLTAQTVAVGNAAARDPRGDPALPELAAIDIVV